MNGYTDEKILMLMLVLFLWMLMLMRQLMVLLILMLNVDVNGDIVTQAVAHFGAYHRPSDGLSSFCPEQIYIVNGNFSKYFDAQKFTGNPL